MFERLAKSLIRLHICASWSEPWLVAHTTLLELSCCGSFELLTLFQPVSTFSVFSLLSFLQPLLQTIWTQIRLLFRLDFIMEANTLNPDQTASDLLLKLVHICSCCNLDQQATATFRFKKDGRQTITNYCSEISKREKHKFNHFSLKGSRGTEGVAEYMTMCNRCQLFMTFELYHNTELGAVIDRNKDTRCIPICIPIRVFHIAINTLLAYCCTPTDIWASSPKNLSRMKRVLNFQTRKESYRNLSLSCLILSFSSFSFIVFLYSSCWRNAFSFNETVLQVTGIYTWS